MQESHFMISLKEKSHCMISRNKKMPFTLSQKPIGGTHLYAGWNLPSEIGLNEKERSNFFMIAKQQSKFLIPSFLKFLK